MTDNHVTVYHGTTAKAAEHIKLEGIKPGLGTGADKWAKTHGFNPAGGHKKRKASVFVSLLTQQSIGYANYAAVANKDDPVVLTLKVPKEDFDKAFIADEASDARVLGDKPIDFRTEHSIPPAWIVDAVTVEKRDDFLLTMNMLLGGTK